MKLSVLAMLLLASCDRKQEVIVVDATVVVHNRCDRYRAAFLENISLSPRSFPITVIIPTRTTNVIKNAIESASQTWNGVLGKTIFTTTVSDDHVSVTSCGWVMIDDTKNQIDGGYGYAVWDACNATVLFFKEHIKNNEKKALVTATHELGHVLNLRHEDDPSSVMFHDFQDKQQTISELSKCMLRFTIDVSHRD